MTNTRDDLLAEAVALGMVVNLADGTVIGGRGMVGAGYWVRFTPEGIPGWFSPQEPEPLNGAVFVEAVPPETLITHRWVAGEWILRDPVKPVEPTAEEIEAERKAEAAALVAAEAARQESIEMEIVRLSGPDQLLRSMGKITIAELNLRVAAIRARVEDAA